MKVISPSPILTVVGTLFILLLLSTGCDSAKVDDGGDVEPDTTLRGLAEVRGLDFGAGVEAHLVRQNATYAGILSAQFSTLTPGNSMKFGPLRPTQTSFTFTDADQLVTFAESSGMKVRGHTLLWHQQNPQWLTSRNWTRQQLIDIMQAHISAVVGRYKGRIYAWDVVNEGIDDDGSLRATIWSETIGPDYMELAFHMAHEADPDALLFYNDYNAEGAGAKSDAVYNLVSGLVAKGVPIDGVGMQMHVLTTYYPAAVELKANMRRLGDLGLTVHITELDVRIPMPTSDVKLAQQAAIYGSILDSCLASSSCNALTIWGITDLHSWIPSVFPGYGAALIFDEDFLPKPAYYEIRDGLSP